MRDVRNVVDVKSHRFSARPRAMLHHVTGPSLVWQSARTLTWLDERTYLEFCDPIRHFLNVNGRVFAAENKNYFTE